MKYFLKINYLRNILIISSLLVIVLPLYLFLFIFPSFTAQLTNNTEDEAIRVGRHLMTMVISDQNELTNNSMSAELQNQIKKILQDFKLMKLKLFSKSGETIYSTAAQDVGVINKNTYFHEVVAKGNVYTKVVKKDTKSLEGQLVTADVVETYVPIIKNDTFMGAFEIYYDITARKKSLTKLLSTSAVAVLILTFSLMAAIVSVLIRASKNIIRREQIEGDLRESEEKLRAIFVTIPDPVVMYNTQGHPKYLNPAFTQVFGWSLDELRDKRIPFVPEDQKEITGAKIKELYEFGKPIRIESQRLTKEGQLLDVHISAALTKDSDGNPMGLVVNLTDITKRKQLESQLQQAFKMESIGTLAGGIAHDFNNMLGIIVGNTELAMDDVPEWNPARQSLEEIRTASMRARDVVKQILAFSRKSPHEMKPVRISPIVKGSLKLLRSSIPTTIEIRHDILCESDTVRADPTQINQVLINLCTNAAHAMGENGGILEVSIKNIELGEDAATHYHDLAPGNYVKLTVSDTGQGIEPQILERVFDPYFTTKKVGEGSGMGLAMVHGIVKSHGGGISTSSEAGKGTTFHVLFPYIQDEPEQEIEIAAKIPQGNERILFVDDEKAMVDAIQPMLERLGYQVAARTSSIEALEAFRAKPDKFDLVITDFTMPNMSGLELTKKLLKVQPNIPTILCTGYSEHITEDKAKEKGIRAFIMKPVVLNELANTIRMVLDEG